MMAEPNAVWPIHQQWHFENSSAMTKLSDGRLFFEEVRDEVVHAPMVDIFVAVAPIEHSIEPETVVAHRLEPSAVV